jgi:hypothetical protein
MSTNEPVESLSGDIVMSPVHVIADTAVNKASTKGMSSIKVIIIPPMKLKRT